MLKNNRSIFLKINRPLSSNETEKALRIILLIQTIIMCINFIWALDVIIHNPHTDYSYIIGFETLSNLQIAYLLYRIT